MTKTVIVVGAGMVGVSTAIGLLKQGFDVVLVDKRKPGQETSYGNAGLIQSEAVEPYAFPQDWGAILKVIRKGGADVNYHLSAMPKLALPLLRYWKNSQAKAYAKVVPEYSRLIAQAIPTHAELIDEAKAGHLVRKTGWLKVTRDPQLLEREAEHAQLLKKEYGIDSALLDKTALEQLEPQLRTVIGAIHWTGPWSVRDPGALVEHYADLFMLLGGVIATGDANTLTQKDAGWQIQTNEGAFHAENAVIALGPWAAMATRKLGYKLPLFTKRGYHQHFQDTPLTYPTLDADNGYVLAPMRRGVRLTTGAEFAGLTAKPSPVQLNKAVKAAQEIVNLGAPVEAEPWVGNRPCTVDMKPVIGAAPKHKGLWFNFGHGHQGFTLGPASAKLLVQQMMGQPPYIDPSPYLPARFK